MAEDADRDATRRSRSSADGAKDADRLESIEGPESTEDTSDVVAREEVRSDEGAFAAAQAAEEDTDAAVASEGDASGDLTDAEDDDAEDDAQDNESAKKDKTARKDKGRSGKGRPTPKQRRAPERSRRTGPIAFVGESIGELRKVVYPTATQLRTYFVVVLVFVCFIIAYVSLLDLGFGALVLKALGG